MVVEYVKDQGQVGNRVRRWRCFEASRTRTGVSYPGQQHELSAEVETSGERGRNRTYNLLIKSQLLCQLSYAPVLCVFLD